MVRVRHVDVSPMRDLLSRRIITNKPGPSQDFRPLPTARRADDESRPTWGEDVIRKAPPRVLSAERRLTFAVSDEPAPGELESIARVALPISMPVSVLLNVRDVGTDILRQPNRAGEPADFRDVFAAPSPQERGRFLVQYGVGDFSQVLHVDLSDGTLQLPSAQFVNVFAWASNPSLPGPTLAPYIASVQVRPGHNLGTPRAYYTTQILGDQNQPSGFIVPRGARAMWVGARNGVSPGATVEVEVGQKKATGVADATGAYSWTPSRGFSDYALGGGEGGGTVLFSGTLGTTYGLEIVQLVMA